MTPSFPTRRSSDLPEEPPGMPAIGGPDSRLREKLAKHRCEIGGVDQRRSVAARQRPLVEQFGERPAVGAGPDRVAAEPFERLLQRREQADRKSTRLNSSH